LYILSSTVFRAIGFIWNGDHRSLEVCSTYNLRLSNLFLSTLSFIFMLKIILHLNETKKIKVCSHYFSLFQYLIILIIFFLKVQIFLERFERVFLKHVSIKLLLSISILHRHWVYHVFPYCLLLSTQIEKLTSRTSECLGHLISSNKRYLAWVLFVYTHFDDGRKI
jgi:hypothetical protein